MPCLETRRQLSEGWHAFAQPASEAHVADPVLRNVIEAVLEEDADLIRYLADR
jgi:hypothetical protein